MKNNSIFIFVRFNFITVIYLNITGRLLEFSFRFPSCLLAQVFNIEFYAGFLGQANRSVFAALKLEGFRSFLFWFVY